MLNMYDILILGAGVAGLHAGYLLNQHNEKQEKKISFLLLEINKEAGRKLCLAGGGYGNLTNSSISHENYVGLEPKFTQYALKKFSYKKALNLFYTLDIPLEERDFGQIFSLIPASNMRDRLAENLPIDYDCDIFSIKEENGIFTVETSRGKYQARKIILATGSCAYPQINATDRGLELAKDLGLKSKAFEPALTPFLLPHNSLLCRLAGINLDVGIEIAKKKLIRPLMFTHTGISGPAVLILSCYYGHEKMNIDFLPHDNIIELCHDINNGRLLLKNLLKYYLPDRLVFALCPQNLQDKKVAELSKKERLLLENILHKHDFDAFNGNNSINRASFQKAEAARNGILTNQLDTKTMQVLENKNIYIVGEVMDITGQLGGYNIHWALASSFVAMENILKEK